MPKFTTMASSAMNTMKSFLKEGFTGAGYAANGWKGAARGFGMEHAATMLSDSGMAAFNKGREGRGFFKGVWHGLGNLGTDSFKKGYGTRLAVGAGVGAAAGGAKSYYEGDGAGG